MNRDQIRRFAARGAALASETQGTLVIFRGKKIRVRISTAPPSLDMASGGFSQKQSWRLRIAGTICPAPKVLETLKDVATGRTYVIRGCIAAGSSPLACEHIAEAEWQ
jgi:hypothetical protein